MLLSPESIDQIIARVMMLSSPCIADKRHMDATIMDQWRRQSLHTLYREWHLSTPCPFLAYLRWHFW